MKKLIVFFSLCFLVSKGQAAVTQRFAEVSSLRSVAETCHISIGDNELAEIIRKYGLTDSEWEQLDSEGKISFLEEAMSHYQNRVKYLFDAVPGDSSSQSEDEEEILRMAAYIADTTTVNSYVVDFDRGLASCAASLLVFDDMIEFSDLSIRLSAESVQPFKNALNTVLSNGFCPDKTTDELMNNAWGIAVETPSGVFRYMENANPERVRDVVEFFRAVDDGFFGIQHTEETDNDSAASETGQYIEVQGRKNVNVRDQSKKNGRKIGIMQPGKRYPVLGKENGWYEVLLEDGTKGYVSGKLVIETQ